MALVSVAELAVPPVALDLGLDLGEWEAIMVSSRCYLDSPPQ